MFLFFAGFMTKGARISWWQNCKTTKGRQNQFNWFWCPSILTVFCFETQALSRLPGMSPSFCKKLRPYSFAIPFQPWEGTPYNAYTLRLRKQKLQMMNEVYETKGKSSLRYLKGFLIQNISRRCYSLALCNKTVTLGNEFSLCTL